MADDPIPDNVVHFLRRREGWLTVEPNEHGQFTVESYRWNGGSRVEGTFDKAEAAIAFAWQMAQRQGLSVVMSFTQGREPG